MAFFEPGSDRIARYAKHPRETTQGGPLVIRPQNLVFAGLLIAVGLRLLAQTALTGATPKSLFAIARLAVFAKLRAAAVIAFHVSLFYNRSPL